MVDWKWLTEQQSQESAGLTEPSDVRAVAGGDNNQYLTSLRPMKSAGKGLPPPTCHPASLFSSVWNKAGADSLER